MFLLFCFFFFLFSPGWKNNSRPGESSVSVNETLRYANIAVVVIVVGIAYYYCYKIIRSTISISNAYVADFIWW